MRTLRLRIYVFCPTYIRQDQNPDLPEPNFPLLSLYSPYYIDIVRRQPCEPQRQEIQEKVVYQIIHSFIHLVNTKSLFVPGTPLGQEYKDDDDNSPSFKEFPVSKYTNEKMITQCDSGQSKIHMKQLGALHYSINWTRLTRTWYILV